MYDVYRVQYGYCLYHDKAHWVVRYNQSYVTCSSRNDDANAKARELNKKRSA